MPLNHYHIIAAICQKIGLVNNIDKSCPIQERKISVGHIVKALIINGLGMLQSPLYFLSSFFKDKDVEGLVGHGICADDLNDDSIGRAMDILFKAGVTEVFAKVASHALNVFGIVFEYLHLDSTSFSVHGEEYN